MGNLIKLPASQINTVIGAVKAGLEVSSTARATSTKYHSKTDQVEAAQVAVNNLRVVDKSLPLLLSNMKDCTQFFIYETLKQELKGGSNSGRVVLLDSELWFDAAQEFMLLEALSKLTLPRALRLAVDLIEDGVSNNRTKRVITKYVFSSMNEFRIVKYRTKYQKILKGLHRKWYDSVSMELSDNDSTVLGVVSGRFFNKYTEAGELLSLEDFVVFINFLNKNYTKVLKKDYPVIYSYHKLYTETDERKWFEYTKVVDNSVIYGIVSTVKNPLFETFFDAESKLKDIFKTKLEKADKASSDEQTLRKTKRLETLGVSKSYQVENVSSEALLKTKYESRGLIDNQIKSKARSNKINLPYGSAIVVLDHSLSSKGSVDSKNTLLAQIDYLGAVLQESLEQCFVYETQGEHTDLAGPVIEGLEENPDVEAILIVSDGYENYPYHGFLNDLIEEAKSKGFNTPIVHFNPQSSSEMKARTRTLGNNIATMAGSSPAQIETQYNLNLIDLNPKQWLENNYSNVLGSIVESEKQLV